MANYDVESHTYIQNNVLFFIFWHPMLVRPVMKRLFFPSKTKEKKARFARASHDDTAFGCCCCLCHMSTAEVVVSYT